MPALQQLFTERAEGYPVRLKRLAWSTIYRLNVRLAERFRQGPVLLAGDSAHVHSPFGGQGINMSIQDAYNLGWKLEAALRGFPTPLASYEEERLRVAADVLGLSSGLQRENYDRLASETIAENNRDIYQLNLSYRGASLSIEARTSPGRVQAGDRAPDAPCALASGMPTRLFEQFRGPHWTILQFGAVSERPASLAEHVKWLSVSSAGGGGQLVDRDGLIARAYGLSSTREELLAIRPDGYIGMACEELSSLIGYLRRAGC